jgi:hypothetical protein
MEPGGRNRWQIGEPRKRLKQADRQREATHGNRFAAHGKEGVDGSSPSEASFRKTKPLQIVALLGVEVDLETGDVLGWHPPDARRGRDAV